jgi:hypothetical protein
MLSDSCKLHAPDFACPYLLRKLLVVRGPAYGKDCYVEVDVLSVGATKKGQSKWTQVVNVAFIVCFI